MRRAARLEAAIEVLTDLETRRRPAADALKDWGLSHRFAGSSDRAVIGNLVYDAVRKRASIAWAMGDDGPRALVLGTARHSWGMSADDVAALCDGGKFAPGQLDTAEREALQNGNPDQPPPWVAGDYPEWLAQAFDQAFGVRAVEEGRALSARAPVDLRVNSLKTTRPKVLKALARFNPQATPISPLGVRLAAGQGWARSPNVQVEPGFAKGWFEVQDEASQITAMLAGAGPGLQVVDICAGAGGKTLCLAASMANKGQIFAYDADRHRLVNIWARLERAGLRNVQVLDAGDEAALDGLEKAADLVVADAPCSGSGAWRRRPDAKWRLSEKSLGRRLEEQRTILARAARLVKPGGRLAYITCSVLPRENADQAAWFEDSHPGFRPVAPETLWAAQFGGTPMAGTAAGSGLQLTPGRDNMDGFFIAVWTLAD